LTTNSEKQFLTRDKTSFGSKKSAGVGPAFVTLIAPFLILNSSPAKVRQSPASSSVSNSQPNDRVLPDVTL
jgi:hypothetical protein